MAERADGNSKFWRAKAEEARRRAGEIRDLAARRIMLEVAKGYDEIGDRAERREGEQQGRRLK